MGPTRDMTLKKSRSRAPVDGPSAHSDNCRTNGPKRGCGINASSSRWTEIESVVERAATAEVDRARESFEISSKSPSVGSPAIR